MQLEDAFIQSNLHCIQCMYLISSGIKPNTFALLVSCNFVCQWFTL